MSSNKDFYQILGINKNSSPEDIKQAYRKLAREHHPDMVKDGDKAAAEQRFKEINEAYQILSDPQKKQMFDQYGSAAFTQGGGGQNPGAGGFGGFNQGNWGPFSYSYSSSSGGQDAGFGQDFDPMDVFEQFFGFRGFGGGQRAPKKGKNLYYEMTLTFAEAVFGVEKEIKIESGKVTIKIPVGAREGMEMKFEGHGMQGPQGTQNGDLFLVLHVNSLSDFEIYNEHILIKKEINFAQAVLGDVLEIPVVDVASTTGLGIAKLKIPEGTQHGDKLLIRGKGMPRFRSRGQGDAIVQVFVKIPKKVTREQRDILQKYKEVL